MKKSIIKMVLRIIVAVALCVLTIRMMPVRPTDLVQATHDDVRKLQNGDIIFQTSQSSQSKAIQLATKSKYSHHMGLLYEVDGEHYVYEAVQPVKLTKLNSWI